MNKKFVSIPLLVAGICCLQNSCKIEDYYLDDFSTDSVVVTPSVGVPVGKTVVTLDDLFKHDGLKGVLVTDHGDVYNFKQHGLDNEIPLPFYVIDGTSVSAADTLKNVDLDEYLGDGNLVNDINLAKLKLTVHNGMPFGASLRLIFVDSLYNRLSDDRHDEDFLVKNALIGTDYKPSKPVESSHVFEYTGKDLDMLRKTKHIIVDFDFVMPEFDVIHLDQNYKVDASAKLYANGKIMVNEID